LIIAGYVGPNRCQVCIALGCSGNGLTGNAQPLKRVRRYIRGKRSRNVNLIIADEWLDRF
jgi:hypothetical protein